MAKSCPVCGQKLSGKPVKGEFFCQFHRQMAVAFLQTEDGKSSIYLRKGIAAAMKQVAPRVEAEMARQGIVRKEIE